MDLFSVLLLGIGVAAVSQLYERVSRGLQRKQKIKARPLNEMSKVSGAQLARIKGEIRNTQEPLIAPLSGVPCVCFEVLVEEATGDKNQPWITLTQDTRRQNFMLVQNTEQATIKVLYADIYLAETHGSCAMHHAPPRVRDFLERQGAFTSTSGKSIRYTEGVLRVGAKATISGYARREADMEAEGAGYREQATRLIFQQQEDHPLYICDELSGVV